jgi:hypothetical protein
VVVVVDVGVVVVVVVVEVVVVVDDDHDDDDDDMGFFNRLPLNSHGGISWCFSHHLPVSWGSVSASLGETAVFFVYFTPLPMGIRGCV